MAKLKYAPGIVPIVNEHLGFTFLPNHYGHSVTSGQRNSRTRYHTQTQKMQNLSKCIRQWRNMTAATVLAWDTFAATYPQASRRNPAVFLTGYQLFLKRNHYVFLNEGIESDFMELPVLEALSIPDISFSINQVRNCMDVTEPYIQNYGNIPAPGQFVLLKAYPMAINSGQFFEPIIQTLEVLESYIDGLFISINYVSASPAIMFSVYLSKVIHQSVKYAGTKVKYMSCFKPSTFLELTDTPATYVGQAANQVVVKADETGLEFIPPGGGGLTCADLVNCPTIISINQNIQNIATSIIQLTDLSIPPVNFGLLYNYFMAVIHATFLRDGWIIPYTDQMINLYTHVGGSPMAGYHLKGDKILWWSVSALDSINDFGFNWKGTGRRSYSSGVFDQLRSNAKFWSTRPYNASSSYMMQCSATSDAANISYYNNKYGLSLIPCKLNTTLSEGATGVYIGNNGRIYKTVCINSIEWLADPLAETLFNDKTPMSEVTLAAEWITLSTPAFSAYDNDWSNV